MSGKENAEQPLESSEDISQYLLNSRSEIVYTLRDLIEKKSMVTVYFNRGKDFILTALLTVLPERGAVVFDCGSRDEVNQKLLGSDRIIFVTSQNGIKIQFVAESVQEVQFHGKDAFITDLPKQLLRLQRREFYRLEIPGFAKIECDIPNSANGKSAVLPIHDISLGGVSLMANKQFEQCELMEKFNNCRIDLKDFGIIHVDLEVRNVLPVPQKKGGSVTRVGCKFIDISPVTQAMVQRYMVKVEKEKRALIPDIHP